MSFEIPVETYDLKVSTVTLGATEADGGTRKSVIKIGGAAAMPFHHFDGSLPHKPVVAMEVFDSPPRKYPEVLNEFYGGLLEKPAEMAKKCVEKYGAEAISVRLVGAHPHSGDKSPEECSGIVKSVLDAVGVPVIVTGVNSYEKNNEIMKRIAEDCQGERLLLNWVETDNYKTIVASALAYNHCVVLQSPIDVNIAKQLNILVKDMGLGDDRIVMDPMTSALGYGLDYGYTIAERLRLTALESDELLVYPMLFNVGYECSGIKEMHVDEEHWPEMGDLNKRAALWEIITASSLMLAGGDLFIMYHPKAVEVLKNKINELIKQ